MAKILTWMTFRGSTTRAQAETGLKRSCKGHRLMREGPTLLISRQSLCTSPIGKMLEKVLATLKSYQAGTLTTETCLSLKRCLLTTAGQLTPKEQKRVKKSRFRSITTKSLKKIMNHSYRAMLGIWNPFYQAPSLHIQSNTQLGRRPRVETSSKGGSKTKGSKTTIALSSGSAIWATPSPSWWEILTYYSKCALSTEIPVMGTAINRSVTMADKLRWVHCTKTYWSIKTSMVTLDPHP